MAKVVIDFGLCVIGLCKSCIVHVRKLGSSVLTVPGTKYRIVISVRSSGQGRHWFWSVRKLCGKKAGPRRSHSPGTEYRMIIWLEAMAKVVLDFGLCESCVVRKLGSGVLTVPGTKYRIKICVTSNGQGRHWFWSLGGEKAGLCSSHCSWYKTENDD